MTTLKEKAKRFYDLHHQTGRILVLPNGWDVITARVFEEAGFPAVATSSGAVSTSLGYPDGQKITRQEMLGAVERMSHALTVPLSADMEAGYGKSDEEMAELVRGLINAEAVGLNIEDSTGDPQRPLEDIEVQCQKIRALRKSSEEEGNGVHLFINARTDAFYTMSDKSAALEEAVARGRAYREAGADCIFVMRARDAGSISEIVKRLNCPINIILGSGSPSITELERIGVARVSFGTSMVRASIAAMKNIASGLKEGKTYDEIFTSAITYDELNRLSQPAGKNL
ncbi:MAG TPA: isocitrate lyase/phosphoenolpyruvate mutase family protein [Nitrososphaerales archaeon]|nr:isocitrate lyase/phosphoenolpyruvate mutase family protein [Nitrososphaerales archaeon]